MRREPKPMTMGDIARLLKISRSTVSRAFSGSASIKKSTAKKVLRTAREFEFVPNTDASNLRKRTFQGRNGVPTIRDIAQKLKLSTSTVSRCLSFHVDASPETRSKVLKTAERMGFVYNDNARRLQQRRKGGA